jgi:hypothetical protein
MEPMSEEHKKLLELMQKQEKLLPELQPYLETADNTWGWPMLRHPLVFSVPYMEHMNAMYNEQYLRKREYLDKSFQESNWSTYVFLHERPYRFKAFDEISQDIESDRDYWELFGNVWVDSENIWQNIHYIYPALRADRSDREYMMDEKERKFLSELPDKFTIYRGHTRRNRKGYSWTLNSGKARWFAGRFNEKSASVASAICSKKDVIAVFLGRGEFEVVVDPINLKIDKVGKLRRSKDLQAVLEKAKEVFKLNPLRTHHGPDHWEQVERNAIKLAKLTPNCDVKVARLFAILHDCMRSNEDEDKDHGERSADYATKLYYDALLDISASQQTKLIHAIRFHNEGLTHEDPTIGVCWDADRLDLPRVGIMPDVNKFSTQAAKDGLSEICWSNFG